MEGIYCKKLKEKRVKEWVHNNLERDRDITDKTANTYTDGDTSKDNNNNSEKGETVERRSVDTDLVDLSRGDPSATIYSHKYTTEMISATVHNSKSQNTIQ